MLLMDHRCPDLAPTNEQLSTIYGYFPVGSGGYCAVEKNLTLGAADPVYVPPRLQYSEDALALNIDWNTAAELLAEMEQHVPNFPGGDRHAAFMNQAIAAAGQAGRLSTECSPTSMMFTRPTTVALPPVQAKTERPGYTKTVALPTPAGYSSESKSLSGLGEINICLLQLLGLIGNRPYPLADDLKQLVIINFGLKPKPFFKKPVFIVGAGVVVVGVAAWLFLRD